jgi:hypothetical protein
MIERGLVGVELEDLVGVGVGAALGQRLGQAALLVRAHLGAEVFEYALEFRVLPSWTFKVATMPIMPTSSKA